MKQLLLYHMLAFFAGFVLDLIFGDPQGFPHPVRWIGAGIAHLTDRYLKKAEGTIPDEAIRSRKRRYG
ncbi:MAG: cobalamin biosynthesis protein CobD, partial [Chordicoccus sp.]